MKNKWKVGFCVILSLMVSFGGWLKWNSNHYNNTLDWIYSIPVGADITFVKKNTPHYLKINWANPEKAGNKTIYLITTKWNYDLLEMSKGLVFEHGKFKERYAHK